MSTLLFVIAVVTLALTEVGLLWAAWRLRHRASAEAGTFRANVPLDLVWAAAPVVLLALLAVFTWRVMQDAQQPTPAASVHIRAVGRARGWEFFYPDFNISTLGEVVAPVGAQVEISVETEMEPREFWVPELFGRVEARPGQAAQVRFTPRTAPADYFSGQCAPYCGSRYTSTDFVIVVKPPEEFVAWVAQQPTK